MCGRFSGRLFVGLGCWCVVVVVGWGLVMIE